MGFKAFFVVYVYVCCLMESLFAFDDIIFILYILAFAEQIHDLMKLELNTFTRYV